MMSKDSKVWYMVHSEDGGSFQGVKVKKTNDRLMTISELKKMANDIINEGLNEPNLDFINMCIDKLKEESQPNYYELNKEQKETLDKKFQEIRQNVTNNRPYDYLFNDVLFVQEGIFKWNEESKEFKILLKNGFDSENILKKMSEQRELLRRVPLPKPPYLK